MTSPLMFFTALVVIVWTLTFNCQVQPRPAAQSLGVKPCIKQKTGLNRIVCVCNSTYCDTVEPNSKLTKGKWAVYQSTQSGSRLNKSMGTFESQAKSSVLFTLKKNLTYQSIIGFGGAFTDSSGINILSLSRGAQDNLLKSYYSPSGIEYTVGRIPMASCDFSTREYSYDDSKMDFELKNFSLAMEDLKYKIPVIQRAIQLSARKISIFGSPWSAPYWMKTNQNMTGNGSLIGEPGGKYYKTWAMYFVRFLQEYSKHNISLWGLTAQNEPSDGNIYNFKFQAMGWTPEHQRDFIGLDLGPALHKNGFSDVKLMILDDDRMMVPYWTRRVFTNATTNSFISGTAVHWYFEKLASPVVFDDLHSSHPDKFILATEACAGSMPWEVEKVALGDWGRAEQYAHSILQDLNHWVTGWTDWNIALDEQGGPNWVQNFVDSPIIVNKNKDEFYKQPMFYAMGHFSKFILPDAKRVELSGSSQNIASVAFINKDSSIVVVLHNSGDEEAVTIHDPDVGFLNFVVPTKSIQTFIWWI